MKTRQDSPLAIYVHWPYCSRICPYCDFNVYKGARNEALVSAILKDLEHWRGQSGPRTINSIHFGGGTPSLMSENNVGDILDKVRTLWGLPEDIEIGLEANPSDADDVRWAGLRRAGVNRLSLGVQSFQDHVLEFFGRDHTGEEARNAAYIAKKYFSNISLDLIFGWNGQKLRDVWEDIETALALSPQHLSTYQLTIEEGTAFELAERRGQKKAADPDVSARFYKKIQVRLAAAGFHHYEVSNFSRGGLDSRHNLAYWRGYDYVGVGPGAHGRLTKNAKRWATETHLRPDAYIQGVTSAGSGLELNEQLEPQDWANEYVMMGLRIREGISLRRYAEITGEALPAAALNELIAAGLLEMQVDALRATDQGLLVLDYVTRKLLGG